MRIPLDLYRILGIPPQAAEDLVEQAYQDRLVQLPRREFSDEAIAIRNEILAMAYETLSDPDQRRHYDQEWGADPSSLEETIEDAVTRLAPNQPELVCEPSQLIGALLILLDLGEYELVLDYSESLIAGDATDYQQDFGLCAALAHWELSHEYWQQQRYEDAATANLKAFARLQRDNIFPDLQTAIRQELYKLRPYRILELLTRVDPYDPELVGDRQKGLELLRDIIQDRGGIEGKGQDHSGLRNDDFLKFVHQLRPRLTVQEQANIFLPEIPRPSRVARYLSIHTLMARAIIEGLPTDLVEAKFLIEQLENCQDLALENAICDLLLGKTESLALSVKYIQDEKAIAALNAGAELEGEPLSDEQLVAFYGFTETWLREEIVPHFYGLTPDDLSLSAYFDDPSVQIQLDDLNLTSPPLFQTPDHLPSTNTESETPMVHSSAAYNDDYLAPPPSQRRRRPSRQFPQTVTNSPEPPPSENLGANSVALPHHNDSSSTDHSPYPTHVPDSFAAPTGLSSGTATGTSAIPTKRRRRKSNKKRVTINPLRFGAFLLCLAGLVGGGLFLLLRNTSPISSLEADQLDLSLDEASPLIPNADTEKQLLLSQPNFTQAVGQQVLKSWLDRKALAFGENHDIAALNSILTANVLKQQQNRVQQDIAQQRFRQYQHNFSLQNAAPNPRNPDQATITARVQETAQMVSLKSKQPIGSPETDDLTVRYQLVRQQGTWKIDGIKVMTVH